MGGVFASQKSGEATFLKVLRFALRLSCPLQAANSTLASRKVFFPPYMPPEKTITFHSRRMRRELCEAVLTDTHPSYIDLWEGCAGYAARAAMSLRNRSLNTVRMRGWMKNSWVK